MISSAKKGFLLFFVFFLMFQFHAQDQLSALIPLPNHISQAPNSTPIKIKEGLLFFEASEDLSFAQNKLKQVFKSRMGIVAEDGQSKGKGFPIQLKITPLPGGAEHYTLDISKKGMLIKGSTAGAVFWAVQTLDQLLLGDEENTRKQQILPVQIDDAPRFGWRSVMLDPARHFIPVKDVKFFIDQIVKFKFNVLQMHLTDDQGWRMEIQSHPELTEKGAFRNPKGGSQGPDNGFYTQAELKELVQYAADRNVEIVPEIDIPGHTSAVLAAHPELACTSVEDQLPVVLGKSTDLMLCSAQQGSYDLYRDIIGEIAQIFPSKYIHLGGDESAIARNWAHCERDLALMEKLGYERPEQLMNYFFKRIFNFVSENNKTPMMWLELDDIRMPAKDYLFDYPREVVLTTWRYGLTPLSLDLTQKHGNKIIMAPGEYAYFDYPQAPGDLPEFHNWGMPVTTLQQSMEFDPGYGRPAAEQQHIMGINATLWGEAIQNVNRATYMFFPRGLALAEAGWTQMENRKDFERRIYPNLTDLMKNGVWVSTSFAPLLNRTQN